MNLEQRLLAALMFEITFDSSCLSFCSQHASFKTKICTVKVLSGALKTKSKCSTSELDQGCKKIIGCWSADVIVHPFEHRPDETELAWKV